MNRSINKGILTNKNCFWIYWTNFSLNLKLNEKIMVRKSNENKFWGDFSIILITGTGKIKGKIIGKFNIII